MPKPRPVPRPVPRLRWTLRNEAPVRSAGAYVVYWMTTARRTRANFGLDRAVALCRELGRPLLVFEPLRAGYPWASDRIHRFVIDGMAANAARCAAAGVTYLPYVEPRAGEGRGLLAALARDAAAVVTDDFPAFFLPRMLGAAAAQVPVRLESVDSNGLLPVRATDGACVSAYQFRRALQATLLPHLAEPPSDDPLADAAGLAGAVVPDDVLRRWPRATDALLAGREGLGAVEIDHSVAPVSVRGGSEAGRAALDRFVERRLDSYESLRNHPDADATSGLSPYLHFGHVGAHEVFARVAAAEAWRAPAVPPKPTGAREGWWGMRPAAEAFLDQVVTWRELGLNMAVHRDDAECWESLPEWARATLDAHRGDARPYVYSPEELDAARTHDRLWNAAQNELVREGRMHNYLRMLWAKKVLEWSPRPEDALATLLHLNNRYALDGRDPNSTSGILWCFGRYDRPWGPERPVFGTIRYMSSDAAARKLRLVEYVRRHAPAV